MAEETNPTPIADTSGKESAAPETTTAASAAPETAPAATAASTGTTSDAPAPVTSETTAPASTASEQPGAAESAARDVQQRQQRDRRRDGRGRQRRDDRGADEGGIESSVVRIYRCAKVVKGGRTFSFGALVVAGDRRGNVGIGYGKANEVPNAVEKATKDARRSMIKVPLKGTTIPHLVRGRSGASEVTLVPAMPGTGVTAGKSVRPVLELAGVTDVLTKAYGSTSPKNLLKATIDALRRLQSHEQVEERRGVTIARQAATVTA